MEFAICRPGVVQYQGAVYNAIECGGGGDCLFLSLAWLLNHYNVPGGLYAHGTLRQNASTWLACWAQGGCGMPVNWVEEGTNNNILFIQPRITDAQNLANPRVYGELAAVAAIVAWLEANNLDVEVHALDATNLHAHVLRSTNRRDKAAYTIHLYFESYIHYRALIPNARVQAVPATSVVANFADLLANGAEEVRVSASLQSKSQRNKTTTVTIPAGTVLEIHHIDVGQGDSTLVLLKDAKEVIHFSLLIDAGESQGSVSGYFDALIAAGIFRPLDMIVLSHPDKDHIADALLLVNDRKYTSSGAVLYDNGRPPLYDSPYDKWIGRENPLGANRRRPPLDAPLVNDFMGVTIEALTCNGVRRHPKGLYAQNAAGLLDLSSVGDYAPEAELQMEEYLYPSGGDAKNDYSIGILISFGHFRYFAAGDLSGQYEDEIAQYINAIYGPVTVWKAGHHGAQGCSGPTTVGALQGRFCVLSFGTDNGHGHPHQAVIDHLESLNTLGVPCTYYSTGQSLPTAKVKAAMFGKNGRDDRGTIIVRTNEAVAATQEAFEVWTTKNNNGWEGFAAKRADPRLPCTIAKVAPSAHLGTASKPRSLDQKAASARRKRERLQEAAEEKAAALRALIEAIKTQLADDVDATSAFQTLVIRSDPDALKVLSKRADRLAEQDLSSAAVQIKKEAKAAISDLRAQKLLPKQKQK